MNSCVVEGFHGFLDIHYGPAGRRRSIALTSSSEHVSGLAKGIMASFLCGEARTERRVSSSCCSAAHGFISYVRIKSVSTQNG